MKSLSRNVALTMFLVFAIGSIYGCAEKPKPITFSGPGVQIWKLNLVWDDGGHVKDQALVLKSSETEKDVFHLSATIDAEAESGRWGKFHAVWEWKGEIRNGAMICNIEGTWTSFVNQGDTQVHGIAKGTFSKRRASGTFRNRGDGGYRYGKWTAERIS